MSNQPSPTDPPPLLLRHDRATNRYLPVTIKDDTYYRIDQQLGYVEITLKDAIDAQDANVIELLRNLVALVEASLGFADATLGKLAQVHRVDLNRELPFELILRKQDLDRQLKTLRDELGQQI